MPLVAASFLGFALGSTIGLFRWFGLNRLAVKYRREPLFWEQTPGAIPPEAAQTLLNQAYNELGAMTPKGAARLVIEVLARARAHCPEWVDRLRLLVLYALIWVSVLVAGGVYLLSRR